MVSPLKPLKWYKSLATGKGRREAGAFIVEGEKAVKQILAAQPEKAIEILTRGEPPPTYRNNPVRVLTESQFNAICQTSTPQGILAVVKLPAAIYTSSLPRNTGRKVLLMEDIQDPGNAGTLIRTAAAFDFSGVIMTAGGTDPLSPKCVQATAGTIFSLWLRRTADYLELVQTLQDSGYSLIAAEVNGKDWPSVVSQHDKILLALGNEAAGLSVALLEKADYRVRVPIIREKAESLNVAVCGAILMYLTAGIT
jgi:TrmH family RNA methyltransferase